MARSKNLTMAGKKQVASLGVLAVVLLLAKFFPMVYGNILNPYHIEYIPLLLHIKALMSKIH